MKYYLDLNGELVEVSEVAYLWALNQVSEDERERKGLKSEEWRLIP